MIAAGVFCGCTKPVYFPHAAGALADADAGDAAVYDIDEDGKADFFMIPDDTGRITHIGYDTDTDDGADEIIDFEAIPVAQCRHLVIILDGFGYDLVREYYEKGGLRLFHPPSRVISPYPSMTDLSLEDAFGYVPCRAYEAKYFDRKTNRLRGGSAAYLAGKNEPYNRLLDYRADTIWDVIGYVYPWKVFGKEINDVKRAFDRTDRQEILAYLVSSAGVGTRRGAEGQRMCLQKVEQLVNQVVWETRGLTKVTLFSDHGHTYTRAERADLEKHLKGAGWRPAKRLKNPHDVVAVKFGLVTFASFATQRPEALAEELCRCAAVEIASFARDQDVIVLGRNGARAVVSRKDGRYKYAPTSGDPLKLKDILADLEDRDGYYDADDLLAATAEHYYPAPLQRLWRAHFALVENPPDVIASLGDKYYFGSRSMAGAVTIESTHGGLNYTNSATFIMSTIAPLPKNMRSGDIDENISKLTGRDFPMRK